MHELVATPESAAIPVDAVSPPRAMEGDARMHGIEFHGQAGEYFRIWIVNVALSLLTLGIYSAWAKVRTERYFYGNTRLDGVPFEYLAEPMPILRGRIFAALLFGAYLLTAQFAPIWNLVVVLLVVVLSPLLIVSALRFRSRYSAWRGISFRFDGALGRAYALFLGWTLLSILTLGVLYPWVKWKQQDFIVNRHRYGSERFSFSAELGPYYGAYAIAVVTMIGILVAFVFGIAGLSMGAAWLGAELGDGDEPGSVVMGVIFTATALMYLANFAVLIGLRTALSNLLWNHSSLGPHRFRSTLKITTVVWIFVGNAVAIVLSLGLLVPWAKIRLARYRAAHLQVLAAGPLDEFAADARVDEAAAGAEVGEAFDIDISI
jgi:uncharacterized membrane protein YjgN (DUF898 family)